MNSLGQVANSTKKRVSARYWMVVMLFVVTSSSHDDRVTLSITGSKMAKDIDPNPMRMGYVFSAFSQTYVVGQIPGG